MTPILVRPVREQLEHDRVIRLLLQRWRRKYLVGINQGNETTASVALGEVTLYPDVVLAPLGRPNKPEVVVEVETGESVNNLEALAEWARLARLKAAFHLYVPAGSAERALRLCTEHNIPVGEIWTFHPVGDQMRFTPVYKAPPPSRSARKAASASVVRPSPRPAERSRPSAVNGSARKTAPRRAAKPAPAKPARPKKSAPKAVARTPKRK